MAKVLEFQLQHHSFQRNPRADLLQTRVKENNLISEAGRAGLFVFSGIKSLKAALWGQEEKGMTEDETAGWHH